MLYDNIHGAQRSLDALDLTPIPTDKKPRKFSFPVQPKTTTLMATAVAGGSGSLEISESPQDINAPSGPVFCGCENHLDKLESEIQLPISANELYQLLFGENKELWEKKTTGNKSRGEREFFRITIKTLLTFFFRSHNDLLGSRSRRNRTHIKVHYTR